MFSREVDEGGGYSQGRHTLQLTVRQSLPIRTIKLRTPYPNSSFTKYKFLQVKNSLLTDVNQLSVLKLFQPLNGDLLFRSMHAASTNCVNLECRS